jgi:hypothetical protein
LDLIPPMLYSSSHPEERERDAANSILDAGGKPVRGDDGFPVIARRPSPGGHPERFCAMAVMGSPIQDHTKGYRRTYLFEPARSGATAASDAKEGALQTGLRTLELLWQRRELAEWRQSILEVARGRRGAAPAGKPRALRSDDEVAKDEIKLTKEFRHDALAALPGFFKKLTAAYEYRVFWFEVHASCAFACLSICSGASSPKLRRTIVTCACLFLRTDLRVCA